MAKKKLKKFLKKAAKAALIGGALYAGAKGLKARGLKGNVLKTAATEGIKYTPGATIPDAPHITKKPKWTMPDDPKKWEVYQAKGGRVGKKQGGRTGKQFGGGLNRRVARPIGGVGAPVRPMPYKHGGSVKSRGVAKRGGGAEIK